MKRIKCQTAMDRLKKNANVDTCHIGTRLNASNRGVLNLTSSYQIPKQRFSNKFNVISN